MNVKIKMVLVAASIVAMLAAAFGIIVIGRSSKDYGEKLELAGIYLEGRDYDNAIAIYNGIIAENRACTEAYVGLSEAYFSKKRTDKAMEILKKGADNADDEDIVLAKWDELFPDISYADAFEEDYDDYDDYDDELWDDNGGLIDDIDEDTETAAATSAAETEASEPEETTVPQETESETETTTVPTTAETTVPTTTAAPVVTTAATVIVTTAPPVTTASPATTRATTAATTRVTTVQTTTAATTTEPLKDVSVRDLTQLTLDEAYAWCSKNNVILNVVGTESNSAEIISQSPAPDSTVKENSTIIVVLAE